MTPRVVGFPVLPVKHNKGLWDDPEFNQVQQQLKSNLLKQFDRSGLTRRAIAAYRTEKLYRQFNGLLSNRDIYHYLVDALPKRTLLKKTLINSRQRCIGCQGA